MGSLHPVDNVVLNLPSLLDYDRACALIEQCVSIDEALGFANQCGAFKEAARRAGDRQLELNAAKIHIGFQRQAGKLLAEIKKNGGLHKGGNPDRTGHFLTGSDTVPVKLKELGVDKKTSALIQKYAALTDEEYADQERQLEQRADKTGRVLSRLPIASEKPRKKAPVIEHKEEAEVAEFNASDAEHLSPNDETYRSLYEQEAAESAEKSERIELLEAELAAAKTKLAAYEENASHAINDEAAQKIAALEAKVEALERDNKALTTQRDHFQGKFADRQSKLNWWQEEYKKVCKATGYERPKKTSTYCTGTGYSDPNDPRAKPLPPMEGAPQKDLAQQLAEEKAAANQQRKEANQWLEDNHLPADDGYQFNGKQATAQATRERFADNRPKAAPAEVKPKIPQSEWGKNALERPIVCREAQKLASIDKLNIIYYFSCLDAGLSEAAALNCAKLTSPNPLLARAGYDQ